ncbi:uncharacterized protein LOC123526159 [Mercenaria mercenaria]|uniref:uncharacterized protein LOC123526159 n=1 Tax=Mercenaria mercenaria TaxID=6596 RepID=UPI00234F22D3|nr:uncharacterized protein LOC123526159 [Mercenaria mercenaria]XP_045161130.2 uncharacterized protein LOC123526159 [Mercenaria mercenaria]XP_045161131.2 uncharacterized protein LOC123526159 [Mercenaria mercenaria]XP_045161132.2 uncharacterized protein LOC123526159 [Mercenaria mercenaria]XP_053378811.1 uncharacterized protein LOC123526159 [Mercenaria mercenaria]XP_053378812.1 uncharacterized protein LOC123526159 [Mercenaria mercenaria]XP_053378813.1 uncharacterized protein LOC123526159 [Mercen
MMASANPNTFYARPVYFGNEQDRFRKTSTNDTGQRSSVRQKQTRFADIDNTSPPPRPPPPRPSRAPKQKENGAPPQLRMENGILPHKQLENGLMHRDKKRHLPQTPHEFTTPEPKPLTRINVTSHDKLWQKETDNEHTGPKGVLSPPLKYITPQTTEEMLRNFDPLDCIDSTSEHSDSSADTMIMMTTEEELKNKERIDHSLKKYTSLKTKNECLDTNRSKASIQTKKNLHIHFADTKGLENEVTNGPIGEKDEVIYSKVVPLHIRTDHNNTGSSPESADSKTNSNHGSPNDSPDDGYGTNSSSGTVSSPFSSSFGSTDFENSYNGNCKKVILPNGAIKPNSVRESWAVKRKQRMIEASDNTVQDQLRELTIIEEEGSANSQRCVTDKDKNSYGMNVVGRRNSKPSEKSVLKNGNLQTSHDSYVRHESDSEPPFVNVSPNDLRRINRQLYVMDSDKNGHVNSERRRERVLPQTPNEINTTAARVPPHHNSKHHLSGFTSNSDDVFVSQTGNRDSFPDQRGVNNWDEESEISASDSLNSGPFLLRGGAEQKYRTVSGSGKIYVSPSGDEGFYSLNRSSRSTSVSSFQPVNEVSEVTENVPELENAPRSPLEVLSDGFLEKWSDMDLNYRNYYGFDEQVEKYSRTDSKVNYFQEKKINTMYGQDNYYRPQNYGSEPALAQGQDPNSSQGSNIQGILRDSKDKNGNTTKSSTLKSQKSGKEKEKESSGSKSKFFQILPNMFKPSGKKHADDVKDSKNNKNKQKKLLPVTVEKSPVNDEKSSSFEYEQEAEYINMGDLPQYCLAQVEYEEKLRKGQYVSMESLRKRPVFASSRDIKKLFSTQDQSFDSINSPGTQRHSFHAMPLSYRHQVNTNPSSPDDMRPRAQSTSATMRNQQFRNSVENRMAIVSRKNAAVMNQARNVPKNETNSDGNLSFHSNSSNQRQSGSRTRLDSGSSGGDSKLSTLV